MNVSSSQSSRSFDVRVVRRGLDQLDDEALVAGLPATADAFVVLYRRYETPILAYFRRRTSGPELAADLAGEVFARALENLRAGHAVTGPFSAWLFGIARHVLIDSYRRGRVSEEARRRLAWDRIALTDDELERIDRIGEDGAVRAALGALPQDQREAVLARIVEQQSYEDIARALECSELVIRKRVSRGLATLRARLRGELA